MHCETSKYLNFIIHSHPTNGRYINYAVAKTSYTRQESIIMACNTSRWKAANQSKNWRIRIIYY